MKKSGTFVFALSAISIPALLYLLAFGTAVLFGVPTRAREGFWTLEKFVYGVVLVCATIFLLVAALRRWIRCFGRARNGWLALFVLLPAAIVVDTFVFLKTRGRQDERIRVEWRENASVFSWGMGYVRIPAGFTYQRENGMDTFTGRFTSRERNLVIEYDIGQLAAEHGGMGARETLTDGARVRFGSVQYSDDRGTEKHFFKVSFPDAGCAHFSMESTSTGDGEIVERIASSFHPQGRLPSWLRPLLPEILRSDCRYRTTL